MKNRDSATPKMPTHPMKHWWKNDPNVLMTYIYWLAGKLPPTNSKDKSREWTKIINQLEAKHRAPKDVYTKLAQYKF